MATRWARSAAIRPIPRSVSSGRSPAVPMIVVIGAVRPAAPAAIPSATSSTAPTPASLWAKSTMTTFAPEPEQVEPPGRALGVLGAKSASPSADLLDGRPEAARATGRRQRVGDVVARQPADRDRDSATSTIRGLAVAVGLDDGPVADEVRPAAARAMAARRPPDSSPQRA